MMLLLLPSAATVAATLLETVVATLLETVVAALPETVAAAAETEDETQAQDAESGNEGEK